MKYYMLYQDRLYIIKEMLSDKFRDDYKDYG